jgi:deoxyribodipyrimidine photo-lyase
VSDHVVWHRSDLRVPDNAPVAAAAEAAGPDDRVLPVFVVDPRYYGERGLACDARLQFMHECLGSLGEQYRERGSGLALLHGDPHERLPTLLSGLDDPTVFVTRDATARYGKARDDALVDGDGLPCPIEAFDPGGIVGGEAPAAGRPDHGAQDDAGAPPSRDGWANQCRAYLTDTVHPAPDSLPGDPLDADVTIAEVEERHAVAPEKSSERRPRGGRRAAQDRLRAFVRRLPDYPRNVAPPARAEQHASRLSAYLKFGVLSTREVYQRIQRCPESRGREMFTSRLFWNHHYRQKLVDWPGWMDRAVNPVFRGLYRGEHDPELERAWREGRTGFPMVDAAMRALVETGFTNFRMRAMCASVFCYILREPWRRGADFMYYHLLDADPGINHPQWQSQTGHVGAHPVRVYNPAKQAREYDADGEYIRRYVPELADLPDEHLPRPEKAPLPVLEAAGVELGEDYPYPVVDYEARAQRAREEFARLDDRAKEALFDDEMVRRRASLSSRSGSQTISETAADDAGDGQSSLGDFG